LDAIENVESVGERRIKEDPLLLDIPQEDAPTRVADLAGGAGNVPVGDLVYQRRLSQLPKTEVDVPYDGLDGALGPDIVGDRCGNGRDEDRGGLGRYNCSEQSDRYKGEGRETHFVDWS
jgi:hypothetical protein